MCSTPKLPLNPLSHPFKCFAGRPKRKHEVSHTLPRFKLWHTKQCFSQSESENAVSAAAAANKRFVLTHLTKTGSVYQPFKGTANGHSLYQAFKAPFKRLPWMHFFGCAMAGTCWRLDLCLRCSSCTKSVPLHETSSKQRWKLGLNEVKVRRSEDRDRDRNRSGLHLSERSQTQTKHQD